MAEIEAVGGEGTGLLEDLEAAAFESSEGVVQLHLMHPNGDPLMHQRVGIYAEGFFRDTELADTKTDWKGNCVFSVKNRGLDRSDELTLRVFEEKLPTESFLNAINPFHSNERLVYECTFTLRDQAIQVPLYEYEKAGATYLPRLEQPENSSRRPQQESRGYLLDLVKAGGDEKAKDLASRFIRSPQGLESLYGVHDKTLKLDSDTTVDLLLNGIYPAPLLKGPTEGTFLVDINWDGYQLDSHDRPVLPNIQVHLSKEQSKLQVEKVSVQFQGGNWTHHVAESEGFERALYLANSMALVKGEIVSHLGLGHLCTEQNAMAVFRTINENPIGALLKPHLRGVMEINRRGTEQIFGENGILNVSGLNEKGINQALRDVLSGVCYTTFTPRTPVIDDHRFAKAEQKYWDIVSDVVEEFFSQHEAEIKAHWYEIVYMSKCLVEQSLPYRPWEGVADVTAWRAGENEIDDPRVPGRVIIDGELKAMRPITHFDPKMGPQEGDLERLKQFSRYAIFSATFWHWAVHMSQGKWGTNLQVAALAPRMPVEMPYGNVEIEDGAKQLSLAHTFTDFDRGELVKNIHGDIFDPLVSKLQAYKDFFDNLGYDIGEMPFGIII